MNKYLLSIFLFITVLICYSQSSPVYVKGYQLQSLVLQGLIGDTLKSSYCEEFFKDGYTPILTIEQSRFDIGINDTLQRDQEYAIQYHLAFQLIDEGITAKPAKIGVARFSGYEIVLILYDFYGLIPVPGQTKIMTFSIEELMAMKDKVPFKMFEVCTIVWDGQAFKVE